MEKNVTASNRGYLTLLLVMVIFLVVTIGYGLLNPLGEAPDEIAHMDLIRFIGREGHLPGTYDERYAAGYKSDSPLLYHALIGAATAWVDYDALPQLKVNSATPRRLLIEDGLSPFAVIHTDDEEVPFQGIVLAWHLARLVSTLFSAGTLVVIYLIVLTIWPGDRWLGLGVTAVVAALLQFQFIASAVNDDNLLGLLCALFALWLLRTWQRPGNRWNYAWLGLWMGLAVTTKYSVALLPLLVVVVLVLAVRRGLLDWQAAVGRFFLFGAAMAVSAGWWFVYVVWHFNQVEVLGPVAGLVKPFLAGGPADASMRQVASLITGGAIPAGNTLKPGGATWWDWGTSLFQSFWMAPGQMGSVASSAFSIGFLILSLVAVAGLVHAWRRRPDSSHQTGVRWDLISPLALVILLLLPLPILRFYLTGNPAESGQGRHILFPAAAAVGLLLTVGVSSWFAPARRRWVGLSLAAVLLAFSLTNFFGFVLPAFPQRLPVRTSADAARGVPDPVYLAFGSSMELLGFQVGTTNQHGVLPVTLVWRSLEYADQDYLVELSAVDGAGRVGTQWIGHPVDGRYPTRAWDPGDVVWDTIWLPLAGVEPGDYELRLRFDPASEESTFSDAEDAVFLTQVAIPSHTIRSPAHILNLPDGSSAGFDVWQGGEPMAGMPSYRYRAAIPVTLAETGGDQTPETDVSLVGPDGAEQLPTTRAGTMSIFLVGAGWPGGEYRLRLRRGDTVVDSQPVLRAAVRQRDFAVPPMATEVGASFGDEVMLLGFDFPQRKTQPGSTLPITLYWQAQGAGQRHYVVFNHLLDSDLRQWGGRDRVPRDYYSTALWAPGEVVRDAYVVPVDSGAPPGIYRLDVGLYTEVAGQAHPVPLVADGVVLDANSVTIASIKVGGPPASVTVENPAPAYPRDDNLGGLITLLGYDLDLGPEALNLTLYWRCDALPPADYTTFVHVRAAEPAAIVAQMDRPPAGGAYPSSLWDVGEVIRDPIRVPIPQPVPAGEYQVVVGLYDLASGVRLSVTDPANGSRFPDDAILLTTIALE